MGNSIKARFLSKTLKLPKIEGHFSRAYFENQEKEKNIIIGKIS